MSARLNDEQMRAVQQQVVDGIFAMLQECVARAKESEECADSPSEEDLAIYANQAFERTFDGIERDVNKRLSETYPEFMDMNDEPITPCGCGAPASHAHHSYPCCGGSMCCNRANI